MVDKAKDDLPTTAAALKVYARKKIDEKCSEYLKLKEEDSLLPVELKEADKTKLNEWYKKKDEQYKEKLKKEFPTKMEKGGMRDYTSEVLKWLLEKDYKESCRVGRAEILIDYLKSQMDAKKIKFDSAKPEDDMIDLKEKMDDSKSDHDDMLNTPTGRYKFNPPRTDNVTKLCKPNLFNERIFIGEELKVRVKDEIRVMHWNILADGLAGSGLGLNKFAKSLEKQFASPKECLIWDFRKWLMLEEIAHYDPDILTLVEVDAHQDYDDTDPNKGTPKEQIYLKNSDDKSQALQYYLEKIGYKMAYKSRKTSFAEQGTGFFWKTDKLTPIKYPGKDGKSQITLLSENFAIIGAGKQTFTLMRFEQQTKGGRKLAVCALHLQSEKEEADGEIVRAKQIWQSLWWLNYKSYTDALTETMKQMNVIGDDNQPKSFEPVGKDLTNGMNVMEEFAVIITGDFNSERKMSIDTKGNVFRPFTVSAPYSAGFKSFYDEVYHGDLPWTSWKRRPAGRTDKYAIDYVFGSKSKTEAVAVLGKVSDDKVDDRILLPNYESASDHISLVVDFKLIEPKAEPLSPEELQLLKLNAAGGYGIWIGVGGAIAVVVISILCWMFLGPEKRRKAESSSTSVD